ncbi:aspartyl protease family protein 1-like [Oryza brachyantha]|uniref:aspartyl protease family protein 1-like n=1 Tax=Oryza brachyantha TaxID=4533 RepID=UPI001ADA0878|nr:aspartyl protease family protein 1-like [Oryza brachyantha]
MARSWCSGLAFAVAAAVFLAAAGEVSGLGLDIHHRYSPVVQRWAEERGHAGMSWPAGELIGSPEYYSTLSRHDHALLARRGLAQADELLSFADGNLTLQLDGSLHYAEVAVGTPNMTFLVALDTGSDLFWVPCDCKQCSSVSKLTGKGGPDLRPYSPSKSSTSKVVTCANKLCDQPNACAATNSSSCPYTINYMSASTSSSGKLVEDVLYLTREKGAGAGTAVQAPVVFGCGQEQTGLFLKGAAADGLMGLGMEKVSVPSILASSGLVKSNSFSMCFSSDGVGRINFGDTGSSDQGETPFIVAAKHPFYNISITSMSVGGTTLPVRFYAIADSGTSFTYLSDPAYTAFATTFNSLVSEKRKDFSRYSLSGKFPFNYCYELSPGQTVVHMPVVSMTTNGGAVFPVTMPYYPIIAQMTNGEVQAVGYCLAVIKSDLPDDIIGQNFMTGLKVVFNRERSVLGWQKFDCYKDEKVTGNGGSTVGSPSPSPATTTQINPQPQESGSGSSDGGGSIPGAVPLPRTASAASRAGGAFPASMMLLLLAAAAVA